MTPKFKLGDTVMCIDGVHCSLDEGSLHVVSEVHGRGFIGVDDVPNYQYHEGCFEGDR